VVPGKKGVVRRRPIPRSTAVVGLKLGVIGPPATLVTWSMGRAIRRGLVQFRPESKAALCHPEAFGGQVGRHHQPQGWRAGQGASSTPADATTTMVADAQMSKTSASSCGKGDADRADLETGIGTGRHVHGDGVEIARQWFPAELTVGEIFDLGGVAGPHWGC
jgi:hypothetical protein